MDERRKEDQEQDRHRPGTVLAGLRRPDSHSFPEWAGCLCSVFRQMRDGLALFRLQENEGTPCLILEVPTPQWRTCWACRLGNCGSGSTIPGGNPGWRR